MSENIETEFFSKALFFRDDFPFAIHKSTDNSEKFNLSKRFLRQFWKITCIVKGSGRYVIGRHRFPLRERSLIVTHPDAETTWDIDGEELQLYNLVFDRSFLQTDTEELSDPYRFLKIFSAPYSEEYESPLWLLTATKEIDTLIRMIYREFEECQPYRETLIRLRFQELILLIMRRVENRSRRNPDWSAQYVSSYVERHWQEDISLPRLAQTLGMSEERLCRLFRERNNCSIMQKVRAVRLREAQKLLKTTALPCFEIAPKCGFRNLSNFYRTFARVFGMTPETFRKNTDAGEENFL